VLERQEEELSFLKNILQQRGSLQQSFEFYIDLKKNGEKK
jgi:hypothetical protein